MHFVQRLRGLLNQYENRFMLRNIYMLFFKHQIHLNERIRIIKAKIENSTVIASNIHTANPKAIYLNSIKQNISDEILKKYVDLYSNLVIKVKDIHHRGCMNNLSPETNTILFYELCKVIKSSFNLFCVEDADNIKSDFVRLKCDPTHKQFTDYQQKRISEDEKKLTKPHISFISQQDIFIAVLMHYCECKKVEQYSDKIQYMLEYIFPKIESELSIYLHSIISYSNMECQRGGKRQKRTLKRRKYKKKTMKHI